MFSNFVI